MSKEFKRCPRCNTKTYINLKRCGTCGLNYDKFNAATNAEAKSAFRMGEKSRVLYSKTVPSDISKPRMFVKCLLGGWFGLHYFSIGRMWRGLVQIIGIMLAFAYSYGAVMHNIRSGYLGYLLLMCGIVWVFTIVTWLSDCCAILFNKFKYPVSLPFSGSESKQITENSSTENLAAESMQDSGSKSKTNANNSEQNITQANNQETIKDGNNNISTTNKGE